jgi:hypothetical protein
LARFAAFCTFLLVVSGAAVTSSRNLPEQAFFQEIHAIAAVAGALVIAALIIWLFRAGARMGWTTMWILIVDAGLGELRRRGLSEPVAGTLHASLAAMLFAAVAAIVLVTSSSWQGDPETVHDYGWPSLRFLSGAAAFLVAVQVAFGAGFRHSAVGVMPHLLGALVVALFIMIVGAFAANQFSKHASLRPMAVWLMVITGIQVFLGMGAFLMRMMEPAGQRAYLKIGLGISVAHVATGSLTLAVAVMLAMEVRRSVLPRAQETPCEGKTA